MKANPKLSQIPAGYVGESGVSGSGGGGGGDGGGGDGGAGGAGMTTPNKNVSMDDVMESDTGSNRSQVEEFVHLIMKAAQDADPTSLGLPTFQYSRTTLHTDVRQRY